MSIILSAIKAYKNAKKKKKKKKIKINDRGLLKNVTERDKKFKEIEKELNKNYYKK